MRQLYTAEEKERAIGYAKKGMPSQMIADAFGCKSNTIRKWCCEAGVSIRTSAHEYQEEMERLGLTASEAWVFCIEWDKARMKVREEKGWRS